MGTKRFLDMPTWAPLYHDLPHTFHDCLTISVLCRAPGGVLQSVTPSPLEAIGDVYRVWWTKTDDVDGYRDVHWVEIEIPVRCGDEKGVHATIEYIDSDMGLAVGREVLGWPKKIASFVWEEADGGFHLECHREGSLLMRTDFVAGARAGDISWSELHDVPDDASHYQVRLVAGMDSLEPGRVEVVRCTETELTLHSSVEGTATLEMFDGPRDPVSMFGPSDVLAARVDRSSFVLGYPDVVASVDFTDEMAKAPELIGLGRRA